MMFEPVHGFERSGCSDHAQIRKKPSLGGLFSLILFQSPLHIIPTSLAFGDDFGIFEVDIDDDIRPDDPRVWI